MVSEYGFSNEKERIWEAFSRGGNSGRGIDGAESGVGSINREGEVRNIRVRRVCAFRKK
jgi:hypothetical protein